MQKGPFPRFAAHILDHGSGKRHGCENAVRDDRAHLGGNHAEHLLHITDNMRRQAAVRIDRGIGGTDAPMPEIEPCKPSCAATDDAVQTEFVPYMGKIRKSGTGCIYQVSERLWEGSFSPRMPDGKRKKFNIYAETRAEVEAKLPELIAQVKADIAAEKTRLAEAERGT